MAPEGDTARLYADDSSIATLYDETFLSKDLQEWSMFTMANAVTLHGQLEHHSPETNGALRICVAAGEGAIINQIVLESIPEERRPIMSDFGAGRPLMIMSVGMFFTAVGTVILPVLLTNKETGRRFRIRLRCMVVPDQLGVDLFIGRKGLVASESYEGEGNQYVFQFDGTLVKVQGTRR